MRVGVVGAGLAGVSVAHELIVSSQRPLDVTVLDRRGHIASGASGAAAGLLHPLSPKGKLLWNSDSAMKHAETKLQQAEAIDSNVRLPDGGLVKPAHDLKQAQSLESLAMSSNGWAQTIDAATVQNMLPGLQLPDGVGEAGGPAALYIPHGSCIDTVKYLNALWQAAMNECNASKAGKASVSLSLQQRCITSSKDLEKDFDAVVFACGAESLSVHECKDLPIELEGGWLCDMHCADGYAQEVLHSTGLVSQPYIVPQAAGDRFALGATREKNTSLQQAIQETGVHSSAPDAERSLRSGLSASVPPLERAATATVFRYGVRAQAPRNALGALPLVRERKRGVIDITGFGARGLVYHALVAAAVASAVLYKDTHSLSDCIANELLRQSSRLSAASHA